MASCLLCLGAGRNTVTQSKDADDAELQNPTGRDPPAHRQSPPPSFRARSFERARRAAGTRRRPDGQRARPLHVNRLRAVVVDRESGRRHSPVSDEVCGASSFWLRRPRRVWRLVASCALKPLHWAGLQQPCGSSRRASRRRPFRPHLERDAVKARLGIAAPMVIAVGTLKKRKGFDVIIDALARVTIPATLVICGDGEERAALRERAEAAGVPGSRPGRGERQPYGRFPTTSPQQTCLCMRQNSRPHVARLRRPSGMRDCSDHRSAVSD